MKLTNLNILVTFLFWDDNFKSEIRWYPLLPLIKRRFVIIYYWRIQINFKILKQFFVRCIWKKKWDDMIWFEFPFFFLSLLINFAAGGFAWKFKKMNLTERYLLILFTFGRIAFCLHSGTRRKMFFSDKLSFFKNSKTFFKFLIFYFLFIQNYPENPLFNRWLIIWSYRGISFDRKSTNLLWPSLTLLV